MSWNGGDDEGKRSSPWGPPGGSSGRSSLKNGRSGGRGSGGGWGGGPGRDGGGPPDFEEFIEKAQKTLRGFFSKGRFGFGLFVLLGLGALALWMMTGFYRVQPGEQGVALFLGRPVALTGPGLNYNWPYPLGVVYTPNTSRLREVTIGMRTTASGTMRTHGVPTVTDVPEESLMLTGDENIIDIDFKVQWQIQDPEAYLFNIQNPEQTVKFVSESAMREIVGRSGIDSILNDRTPVQEAVQKLIQSTLDSYRAGIRITEVQMQKVDPPAAVIDSFRDVQAAKADLERIQNEAQTYANRIVPEARGEAARVLEAAQAYRDQTVAEAEGQANRFLKIYEEYRLSPVVTRERIYLETLEKVFVGTDKILMDQKVLEGGMIPYLPLSEIGKRGQGTPRPGLSSSSRGGTQ